MYMHYTVQACNKNCTCLNMQEHRTLIYGKVMMCRRFLIVWMIVVSQTTQLGIQSQTEGKFTLLCTSTSRSPGNKSSMQSEPHLLKDHTQKPTEPAILSSNLLLSFLIQTTVAWSPPPEIFQILVHLYRDFHLFFRFFISKTKNLASFIILCLRAFLCILFHSLHFQVTQSKARRPE